MKQYICYFLIHLCSINQCFFDYKCFEHLTAVGWWFNRVKVLVTLKWRFFCGAWSFCENEILNHTLHYISIIWSWAENHVNCVSLLICCCWKMQCYIKRSFCLVSNSMDNWLWQRPWICIVNIQILNIISDVCKVVTTIYIFCVLSSHISYCFNIPVNKTHLQYYFKIFWKHIMCDMIYTYLYLIFKHVPH